MLSLHQASNLSVVRQTARIMALKALVTRASNGVGAYRFSHTEQEQEHHQSVRRIHSVQRLQSTIAAVKAEASSHFKAGSIDLKKLFDEVDDDSDGSINKSEFLVALELVKLDGILKSQAAAKDELDRLTKKMATVDRLEKDMTDLEASIDDDLSADSQSKKENIMNDIKELKALIYSARATFNSAAKLR